MNGRTVRQTGQTKKSTNKNTKTNRMTEKRINKKIRWRKKPTSGNGCGGNNRHGFVFDLGWKQTVSGCDQRELVESDQEIRRKNAERRKKVERSWRKLEEVGRRRGRLRRKERQYQSFLLNIDYIRVIKTKTGKKKQHTEYEESMKICGLYDNRRIKGNTNWRKEGDNCGYKETKRSARHFEFYQTTADG